MAEFKKGSRTSSSKKKSTNYRKINTSSLASSLSNASGIDKKIISKGISKTKRLSLGGKAIVTLCLLVGVGVGNLGINLIQRNDQFRLTNGEEVTINCNDTYNLDNLSKYVTCVSFGRDVISSVSYEIKDSSGTIVTSLDTSKEEVYTLTFKSSDIKYRDIKLVQTVSFVQAEDSYMGD